LVVLYKNRFNLFKESEIISAVKAGHTEQFSLLVNQHSAKIFALAKSMLNIQEDAEEVTQDVFLKAFRNLNSFRGEAKFSSFLYRICYNECLNRLKVQRRDYDVDNLADNDENVYDGFYELKREEQKHFLFLAMEKLNPEYKMILTLFYFDEQSYVEISEVSNLTLTNVKVKLHRAKNALAKVLNELLNDEVNNLI